MKTLKFKKQIEEIFGKLKYYFEYSDGTVNWEIYGGFTAEKLFKASDVLNTGTIEVTPTHQGGGCDTCGYGDEDNVEFHATGAKL
jgi:hypothetical protein